MTLLAVESCSSLTFHSDELAIHLANITLWETASQKDISVQEVVLDFQRTLVTIPGQAFQQVGCGAPPRCQGTTYTLLVPFSSEMRRGRFFGYGFHHQPCTPGAEAQCWWVHGHQFPHSLQGTLSLHQPLPVMPSHVLMNPA